MKTARANESNCVVYGLDEYSYKSISLFCHRIVGVSCWERVCYTRKTLTEHCYASVTHIQCSHVKWICLCRHMNKWNWHMPMRVRVYVSASVVHRTATCMHHQQQQVKPSNESSFISFRFISLQGVCVESDESRVIQYTSPTLFNRATWWRDGDTHVESRQLEKQSIETTWVGRHNKFRLGWVAVRGENAQQQNIQFDGTRRDKIKRMTT